MKKLILSLIMVVGFVAFSSAQQKEVVKETVTKEVKKCDAAKKDMKMSDGEMTKKCDGTAKKTCCADKKMADAKKCDANCKKACCADKNMKKEAMVKGFACPMKCEGDKVYDKAGTCPKCNMDLVPVKS